MIDVQVWLEVWSTGFWRASWQGGLAVLAVWSVRRLMPTVPARFQSWLWRLVAFKFVVALLWSAPVEVPFLAPPMELTTPALHLSEPMPLFKMSSADPVSSPQPITTQLLLCFAWATVAAWHAVRIFRDCRAAGRVRNAGRINGDPQLHDQLARLSRSIGLRTPPALLESNGQGSPLLVGIFRPAIVFPETTLNRLDDSERSLVLSHELAHIRRGDLFWTCLAAGLRAVFFFHPLAWFCERELRLAQEIAADELAIGLRRQDSIGYAQTLVSVVGKLDRDRLLPAMAAGVAGSPESLQRRFSAMRYIKPVSRTSAVTYGLTLTVVAFLGVVPWTLVVAESPKSDGAASRQKSGAGDFVSYQDGELTLRGKGGPLVWTNIGDNFKTFHRDEEGRATKPVDTVQTLSKLEPGMAVRVNAEKAEIYFGVDEHTHGTFVSYKDGTLTLIGRADELGETFITKYGTTLSPQIEPHTPVFESVDGGDFKQIGTADALRAVKEGTIVTLRGKNDRIQRIDVGVKKKAAPGTVGVKEQNGWGKFVSYQGGTLTLESNSGGWLVWNNIAATAKALQFNPQTGKYEPAANTADALTKTKVGTWTVVVNNQTTIYLGAKKGQTIGTFVSFKNDRLLMIGKNLDASFTKKYGNNLQFNRFRDDVPAYESVDGGDFKLIGMANKVLGNVKEGTVVTIYAEGDDNITLVQIGAPKQP